MPDSYEKIGDKETETPADATEKKPVDAAEKKGDGIKDDEQHLEQAKKIDEELKTKKTQLEQLQQSVKDETERLRALREERRDSNYQPIDNEMAGEEEPVEADKKAALQIFYNYHPEYRPENDPGNKKFGELNQHFKRLKSGTGVSEVVDTLEYIHKTFLTKESLAEEKPKSDATIGDTTSVPTQTKKISALTRPLNKFEQDAAKYFPGGETAYRKKLTEREG